MNSCEVLSDNSLYSSSISQKFENILFIVSCVDTRDGITYNWYLKRRFRQGNTKMVSGVLSSTSCTYPPYLKDLLSRNAIAGNLFCMDCQGASCCGAYAGIDGPRLSEGASVPEEGVGYGVS